MAICDDGVKSQTKANRCFMTRFPLILWLIAYFDIEKNESAETTNNKNIILQQ